MCQLRRCGGYKWIQKTLLESIIPMLSLVACRANSVVGILLFSCVVFIFNFDLNANILERALIALKVNEIRKLINKFVKLYFKGGLLEIK